MTFGEKLKLLRNEKGWSQKTLADNANTNQQSVGRWENGSQIPGLDAAQALCRALGVPCTVFDDCEHKPTASRGRGRPKADAPAPTKPAATARKKKPKK